MKVDLDKNWPIIVVNKAKEPVPVKEAILRLPSRNQGRPLALDARPESTGEVFREKGIFVDTYV